MDESYSDVRSYLVPLNKETVLEYVKQQNLGWGWDEKSGSFALVEVVGDDEYKDNDLFRIRLEPTSLSTKPKAKTKRVARVKLAFGHDFSVLIDGIYVNANRTEAFCHWPNDMRGTIPIVDIAYKGVPINVVPYILACYFEWLEMEEGRDVYEYLKENFPARG